MAATQSGPSGSTFIAIHFPESAAAGTSGLEVLSGGRRSSKCVLVRAYGTRLCVCACLRLRLCACADEMQHSAEGVVFFW